MSDVPVAHDETVASDPGDAVLLRASMDRGKLADRRTILHDRIAPRTREFEILRESAEHRRFVHRHALSET